MDRYSKFRKEYKGLCKIYYKKLKTYQKLMFELPAGPMAYFAVFLQYLRDVYLLTDSNIATAEKYDNKVVETLSNAVIMYDNYRYSLDEYYKAMGDIINLAEGEDRTKLEETKNKWFQEKTKYFNSFWDIVKQYYELWLRGSVQCS